MVYDFRTGEVESEPKTVDVVLALIDRLANDCFQLKDCPNSFERKANNLATNMGVSRLTIRSRVALHRNRISSARGK